MNRLLLIAFFWLVSSPFLFADSYHAESLLQLNEEISKFGETKNQKNLRAKIRSRKLYSFQDEGCSVSPVSRYETIVYYRFSCQDKNIPYLLSFASTAVHTIPNGKFRLKAVHRIGNRDYLEIQTSKLRESSSASEWHGDDTHIDLPTKKVDALALDSKKKDQKLFQPIPNPNLLYLQSLAANPKRRKDVPQNLEIFFDKTCPLEFVNKDESFYWDQTVSYLFRITCISSSAYSLLPVPSSNKGLLVVSNVEGIDPKVGSKFYGYAILKKINEKQLFWENVKLYHE